MHIRTATITLIAAAALAAGCSSDAEPAAETTPDPAPEAAAEPAAEPAADPAADASGDAAIQIEGFAFSALGPVTPGTEITVTNLDGAPHTLTAEDGSFNTGSLDGDATGSIIAPSTPGTYTFLCNIHPSMTGTLTVEG